MGYHHNGKGGAIVNVASVFGLKTSAALPIFTATKHGVCGFTKSLKVNQSIHCLTFNIRFRDEIV
jgi:15-hydroxyprostaglandin dehydrogenase (NAD)